MSVFEELENFLSVIHDMTANNPKLNHELLFASSGVFILQPTVKDIKAVIL